MTAFSTAIESAQPDDLHRIEACMCAAYAPWRDSIPGLPDVTSGLSDDLAQHTVLVVRQNEDVAGVAVLSLAGPTAILKNLAVDPGAQGGGLGKKLVEACLAVAREAGHARLHLSTHAEMHRTQLFYALLGFAEIKRDGHRVVMSKTL